MAKVLTEQQRYLPARVTDPIMFGNGAPMDSRVAHDLVRGENNMQTYCEPSYGFVFDLSWAPNGVSNANSQCMFQRPSSSYFADGYALLGQVPILVPTQAKKLNYSLGVYRFASASEVPISVKIPSISLYLAAAPVTRLLTPSAVPIPVQTGRPFQPAFISGPYSSTYEATANLSDSSTQYEYMDASHWTDFLTPYNINSRLDNPWAILIATCAFADMAVGERIQAGEFAWWFTY